MYVKYSKTVLMKSIRHNSKSNVATHRENNILSFITSYCCVLKAKRNMFKVKYKFLVQVELFYASHRCWRRWLPWKLKQVSLAGIPLIHYFVFVRNINLNVGKLF